VLLVTAIAGIAPWVVGHDLDCPDTGPHGFFLLAWLSAAALGVASVFVLVSAEGQETNTWLRRAGIALGALVPIAAALWLVIVVVDGVQECGF
jgi:hypothetical protein